MLDLTYTEKVHLDKWDINVRPYLNTAEIQIIYNEVMDELNPMIREEKIMANIIYLCTDLYKDEDADYTYEQLIYSGLWNDILEACPILSDIVEKINNAVKEYNSIENQLKILITQTTDAIVKLDSIIDSDKIGELLSNIK